MSRYLEGTTHQLCEQLQGAGFKENEVHVLGDRSRLDRILAEIRTGVVIGSSPDLDSINPVLVVDRTKAPVYPRAMTGGLVRPDLELTGPDRFSINHTLTFPFTTSEPALGQEVYDRWMKDDTPQRYIDGYVSLIDLIAIRARGPIFYHLHFSGMKLVAMKSAGKFHENGSELVRVPYLYEAKKCVHRGWRWLGHTFTQEYKALRIVT